MIFILSDGKIWSGIYCKLNWVVKDFYTQNVLVCIRCGYLGNTSVSTRGTIDLNQDFTVC